MNVANKLVNVCNKINNAKIHCNEMLVTKGVSEASTLWEVGDKIGEIVLGDGGATKEALIDLIECDITELNIPNGTTSIGYAAFAYREQMTKVIIPNSVETIDVLGFSYCEALSSITIPRTVVNIMDYAFDSCNALSSIVFEENSSLTTLGTNAFSGCTALSSITIPIGISQIGSGTFLRCSNLNSLILPRTEMISLNSTNAFSYTPIASGTGYIYVPQTLLSEYQSATNWSTYSSQFRAIEDYPDIVGG